MKRIPLWVSILPLLAIIVLLACSSAPTNNAAAPAKAEPEKKEAALSTAKPCLERMMGQAARWQMDALPFSMESEANEEGNGQDGKSSVWHARFASPSTAMSRTYHCSGSRLLASPPLGITADRESQYRQGLIVMTFHSENVAVDTDKVASIVKEKGAQDYIKKDPNQPMVYQLGIDPQTKKLIWLVVMGKSQEDSKVILIADATQPKFLGGFKRNGEKAEGK